MTPAKKLLTLELEDVLFLLDFVPAVKECGDPERLMKIMAMTYPLMATNAVVVSYSDTVPLGDGLKSWDALPPQTQNYAGFYPPEDGVFHDFKLVESKSQIGDFAGSVVEVGVPDPQDKKVEKIKMIRSIFKTGLKEAKDFVEGYVGYAVSPHKGRAEDLALMLCLTSVAGDLGVVGLPAEPTGEDHFVKMRRIDPVATMSPRLARFFSTMLGVLLTLNDRAKWNNAAIGEIFAVRMKKRHMDFLQKLTGQAGMSQMKTPFLFL